MQRKPENHGMTKSRLYSIRHAMIQRCYNKNKDNYHNYGGRGIEVCSEWLESPTAFFEWAMANGYDESLTLDRKDSNKGYCPENCRWATYSEQNRTSRNCVLTPEDVCRVRELRATGMLQKDIGKIVGCSQTNISRILAGKRWK